jgi:hypothetical protein
MLASWCDMVFEVGRKEAKILILNKYINVHIYAKMYVYTYVTPLFKGWIELSARSQFSRCAYVIVFASRDKVWKCEIVEKKNLQNTPKFAKIPLKALKF